ncbi:high frequency lysogenization protein HflD [Sansalvadorimonas sp. 2012CJ34-2]|uniref:High frequency lysogenization protein HflD homolog n=1 Tax=Parendozoicomonas callyspongiae TaxID=2942213 RepID=A0ABT0PGJ7_9GAMM|nr:high frequency lysogenization protein HflD [Sansalvadorimonas sp. 2012CJ34-2]
MTHTDSDRTLALAGLFQAASLVEKIAKTAQAPAEELETSINSIFMTSPKDVADVYGAPLNVSMGLRLLRDVLERKPDAVRSDTVRYALTLIHLERKLRGNPEMMSSIGRRIDRTESQLQHFETLHDNIFASLADIYLDTISTFRTRVQVTGDLRHLQNAGCANKIRATLLAGIRSAILWRQVGGRRWHLVFSHKRKPILNEVSKLLKGFA